MAVLSAEGIVPKLVWTKRLENGDVITAQHWLSGRELKPNDMNGENVAELLHKIHHSKELLDMLKRLGKKPLTPSVILEDLKQTVEFENFYLPEVLQALHYLEENLPYVDCAEKVVCHCDVNHNNWLLSSENQLYLIDWDGALIADPAIDIGMLLYWYIDEKDWDSWLSTYGLQLNDQLRARMFWYVLAQTITYTLWYRAKHNEKETNEWHSYLRQMITKISAD